VNRVGDRFFDQLNRSGYADRPGDDDRFAALGVTAVRFPVLWERLAPSRSEAIDWRWTDHRLARLRELRIAPIAGLVHHGSGPACTSLLDPAFPDLLARYARAVAERYPWIDDWTPVNEPLTTARFSGLYGLWYPHGRDGGAFVRALLNQLRGVALAMREIRTVIPAARLVQTEDLGRASGTPRLGTQVAHERHRRWLTWDLLSGRVHARHPLYDFLRSAGASEAELAFFVDSPCAPDVLGVNYYLTSDRWLDDRLDLYPHWSHGGNEQIAYADVEAVRAHPDGILGHERHLLAAWRRYRRPVALTEVHLGCTREEQMRWLVEAWNGARRARARGADVRAVTAWALLGSHDWNSLVTCERGCYEPGVFDIRAPSPRATALATVARNLAASVEPAHPVLRGEGWWRRPDRLRFGPSARGAIARRAPAGAPILIVGLSGTLGRAFQRLCAVRGLAIHVVGRAEMDIADPSRVDAVLRRVHPWAVVNAAGYVRVDAAEGDRDGCWKDNVAGAVNLAAACRRRGVRLVTFSSDLVFDGEARRPYTEEDSPSPCNVYGAAKAEAERRVLHLLSDALVIRTSAFFGPWDDYNFATVTLRTIADGGSAFAADDCVISPTYVPDLVHASLDLLIDGEGGVWHLANEGAVTWYEFARMIARQAGDGDDRIEPCRWRDVWGPAARPSYSVLGSARARLMRPLDAAVAAYAAEVETVESKQASRCASS
jgi:dTDP-4-dehydrorhamnose reductase